MFSIYLKISHFAVMYVPFKIPTGKQTDTSEVYIPFILINFKSFYYLFIKNKFLFLNVFEELKCLSSF